jgi:hypothetical protein
MIAVTIFLVCFVVLVGVVMYLSQTIEHGEARFDSDGKVIKDKPANTVSKHTGPAKPAQRLDKDSTKAKTDE